MLNKIILCYIDPGSGFTIFNLGGWLVAFLLGFLGMFSFFFRRIFGFFKRHKKIFTIMLILVLLGMALKGIFMNRHTAFDKRIIILGFDGLSPEIIEPMMQQGILPNFSRLKEKGAYSRLTTTNPSQSPVAWAGFATGKNPGKSGIFDFIFRDPKNYKLDLSLSLMEKGRPKRAIKTKCFWQYASEAKVPAVIIGHPVTFPPDEIYGRMLSGMGVPDILGTEGTFTFYTSESLDKDKDIGGKVFPVSKSGLMLLNLIGPRIKGISGKTENVLVPFRVEVKDKETVGVEFQNQKITLKKGQWSDWQEVVFKLGAFSKAKGIFKFYLLEVEPEFKLYISPINFDPRAPLFAISFPKDYSKELADNIGLYYTQGMPVDTWAVNEGRLAEKPFLEIVDTVIKETKAKLDFEMRRFEKGILFCYFEPSDIIQHMFWRYIDPQHPLYEKDAVKEYKDTIEKIYITLDDILGTVMQNLKDDDILIVLSDHGFNTFRRAVHVNSWLEANGYLTLKNPYADSGRELLVDIDWSKTKAYSIGFGGIYINQENRESQGIVKPGAETESLKQEIAKKLEAWVDEKNNEPIVHKVYKREEIFWGDFVGAAPDLYIGFNIGYRASWQTAMGGVPEGLIEDNLKKWSGDHLFDPNLIPGVLFINRNVTKDNPSLYDITPTLLKLIGYDEEKLKECDFDGKPLF